MGVGNVKRGGELTALPLFLLHRSPSSYCPFEIRTGYYPPGFSWQTRHINLLFTFSLPLEASIALQRTEISRCFMSQKAGKSLGAVIVIDVCFAS